MAEAARPTSAQPGVQTDPYPSYNFKLQIDGVVQGHFTYCGNMEINIEPILYREGGDHQVVRPLLGRVDYGSITLRYGLTDTTELWEWLMANVTGKGDRRNATISILGTDGATPVVSWHLIHAWPCRWRGAPLDTMARQVAIEELTIVFETLERGETT